MRRVPLPAGTRTGLTIPELLVAMTITLILSSVSTVAYTGLQRRAERLSCTGNLRALHAAFSGYVLDRGGWPQEGADTVNDDGPLFYGWLVGQVQSYGGDRELWICPSERRRGLAEVSDKEFVGSYVPTMFEPGQNKPFEWENQPWLIERVNNHLQGQLMIFPNGRVLSVDEFKAGN